MPERAAKHLPGLDDLAHATLARALHEAAHDGFPLLGLDATAGNGHDTLFLARLMAQHASQNPFTSPARLFSLDIQEKALANTARRLEEAGIVCCREHENDALTVSTPGRPLYVTLLCTDHARIAPLFQTLEGRFQAVMFNLGFLPGSDKHVVTTAQGTTAALEGAFRLPATGGILSLHLYTGHPGGQTEAETVLQLTATLPRHQWRVLTLSQHNKPRGPEHLVLCERI